MKKTLLFSVLAMSASLVAAQAPARQMMTMPRAEQGAVKANLNQMAVSKANLATPVAKVGSYQLKNGAGVELYKMSNGLIAKKLVRNGYLPVKSKKASTHYKTVAPTFAEGFEGYDGEEYDWIPAGWQDVSKTTPAHVAPAEGSGLMNLTWQTISGFFSPAYEGEYMAHVQVSIADAASGQVEEAQDEWLISPAFTVAAGDCLKTWVNYSPAWTLLDMVSFEFTAQNNILEVLISDDNGANWTKVWDVMEDAAKYTEDELWDDALTMSHPWVPVVYDLKDYVGKSIKVAYRYVGQSGESVAVDDITIGEVTPIAKYSTPNCLFNIGFSHDFKRYPNHSFGIYPAYQQITWHNNSQLADKFSWEYTDPASFDATESLFTDTKDLTAPAYEGFAGLMAPIITASLGANSSEYQSNYTIIQAGANWDDEESLWGGCNYDYPRMQQLEAMPSSTNVFGFGPEYDAFWNGFYDDEDNGIDLSYVGLGTFYEKPEVPYMLSYIFANIRTEAFANESNLKVAVYEVSDEGYVADEPMATGTCSGADFTMVEGSPIGAAIFPLEQSDGELTEMVDLTINSGIYVELTYEGTAPTDDASLLTLLGMPEDNYKVPDSFIHLKDADGNGKFKPAGRLVFENGKMPCGFIMSLGVTHNWMFTTDGVTSAKDIAATGGSATFHLNSLVSDGYWTVEGEGLYDWIDYTTGEFDTTNGNQDITFTLQALPDGVEERVANVTVYAPGCYGVEFTIVQGKVGGVEGVKVNANTAKVVDGNIVLNAAKATSAKIYNAAGQVVASAEVKGETVVPAADLAHGMYIVKFNDNTAVKVMK